MKKKKKKKRNCYDIIKIFKTYFVGIHTTTKCRLPVYICDICRMGIQIGGLI